jgi:hypothetical protein
LSNQLFCLFLFWFHSFVHSFIHSFMHSFIYWCFLVHYKVNYLVNFFICSWWHPLFDIWINYLIHSHTPLCKRCMCVSLCLSTVITQLYLSAPLHIFRLCIWLQFVTKCKVLHNQQTSVFVSVTMPAYRRNRLFSIFFIIFLIIGKYIYSNLQGSLVCHAHLFKFVPACQLYTFITLRTSICQLS